MRPSQLGIPLRSWNDVARHAGYENETRMLEHMYSEQGLSIIEIGERLACSPYSVLYHLRTRGFLRRGRGGPNHVPNQLRRLARFDQRVVLAGPLREVAKAAQVSTALLWKYRRWIKLNSAWEEIYATKEKTNKRRTLVGLCEPDAQSG